MIARHKRKNLLNDRERAATVEAAARLHRHLRIDLTNLSPASEDYTAVHSLADAVVVAIRSLTGEDPEWMRPAPAHLLPASAEKAEADVAGAFSPVGQGALRRQAS